MKDYEITKIWADEIAQISKRINNYIDSYKESSESYKNSDTQHEKDWGEEYEQRIECCEWILNQINIPLKIKK